MQELLKRDQTERASVQVGQLGEAARAAYADARESILALRTSLGPGRSRLEALTEYLDRWQEQSEIEATLALSPPETDLRSLAPEAELQLLRIVQEALANVCKHAAARHAQVRIVAGAREIETTIVDDGRGFEPQRVRAGDDLLPHFGLSTMRERAESVGGSLDITSAPGAGTRVIVRLPAPTVSSLERAHR